MKKKLYIDKRSNIIYYIDFRNTCWISLKKQSIQSEGHTTYILIKQFLMTGCLFTKKFIRKKYIAGVLHVWVNLSRSLHVN